MGYNAVDVAFATNMVALNEQTVDLAQLVEERCANRDLVPLAAALGAEGKSDNQVLRAFLVQWTENPDSNAGPGRQPPPGNRGIADDATVARLHESEGPQFDTLWLHTVLANQEGALEQTHAEIDAGRNDDAHTFARMIAKKRGSDIDRIQAIGSG